MLMKELKLQKVSYLAASSRRVVEYNYYIKESPFICSQYDIT